MNPVSAENWQPDAEPVHDPVAERTMPSYTPQTVPPAVLRKNPKVAAFLSLFPGMGNVYNGLYMRGVTFFLVVISCAYLADRGHDVIAFAVAFVWLFNIIDAYRQATLINYGYAQDLGLTDLPAHPRASQGGLAAGILLTLIGVVASLESFFNINFDWLFDLWPLALVGIGLWLIVATVRDRKRVA
ncbi:MAG: LiaI-LiaF-like domain-containing protein [Thermoanaerobaculia bacterium]